MLHRYKEPQGQKDIDTYNCSPDIHYTEIQAPFINKKGMSFSLYPENIVSGIRKLFGMQDIKINDPDFDYEFVIKSNMPKEAIKFLDDHRFKQLIDFQESIHMEILGNEASFEGTHIPCTDVLKVTCEGEITDRSAFLFLFTLFTLTLDRLIVLGVIDTEA